MVKINPFLLAALAVFVAPSYPGHADNPYVPPPGQKVPRPPTADRDYHFDKLDQPIQIPNIPTYSGRSRFMSGLRYPNETTGERVGMTFAVAEDESTVLDWYRTALKNYQWNIMKFSPNDKSITATKGGSTFTLQINSAATKVPGYRTVMVLSYKTSK